MGKIIVVGSLNYDITVKAEAIPRVGETVIGKSISYRCGGKGGNQAYACAKAGAATTMLGAVGDDAYGKILVKSLENVGIHISHLKKIKACPSGSAIVLVDGVGKNSIVAIPGANARVTDAYINSFRDEFSGADVVLLQMEIPLPVVYTTIRLAKEKGCLVVLNPAPVQAMEPDYYKLIDYLTPNETELENLVKDGETLEEKGKRLVAQGVKNVIVTLGENGVCHINQSEVSYYAAKKVNAVDTVGAGDCFNGYFCAALADNKPVADAIEVAALAASISVTRFGAQESIPGKDEL